MKQMSQFTESGVKKHPGPAWFGVWRHRVARFAYAPQMRWSR